MLRDKCLVVFKGRPAVVTALDDKLQLRLLGAESIRVRPKDVEVLHPGPVEKPESVLLSLQSDIVAAWELLQGSQTTLAELAELAYGEYTAQTAWAAYLELRDGLYFKGQIEAISPKTAAEVAEDSAKQLEKARLEAERAAFLERLRTRQLQLPGDTNRLQDVEALASGKTDRSRTLKELGMTENAAVAQALLLESGVWTEMINPQPSRYGLASGNAKSPLTAPPVEDRLDLRGLRAFAIDNDWSSDPDDAISLDGDTLWVHVADPAAVVKPESEADREARARGASYYLPEAVSRMLGPGALEHFAFNQAASCPALSFEIKLAASGEILDLAIHKSLVAVERLSYRQADDRSHDPALAPLFRLAEVLAARRQAAGAVDIRLPEVQIVVSKDEIDIKPILASRSADLVRECMIAAGCAAAKWALRRRLAFPFISQDFGDLPSQLASGYAGAYQLRRSMRPRRLSTQIGAHAGLGLEEYSQVTSPLRRYSDLVAHQQLRLALDGLEPISNDELVSRIAAGEAAAQAAAQAERASRLHWTLAFLLRRPTAVWEAIVVERKGNRASILIPELALEGQLTVRGEPELNASMMVKAMNIKLWDLSVAFSQES